MNTTAKLGSFWSLWIALPKLLRRVGPWPQAATGCSLGVPILPPRRGSNIQCESFDTSAPRQYLAYASKRGRGRLNRVARTGFPEVSIIHRVASRPPAMNGTYKTKDMLLRFRGQIQYRKFLLWSSRCFPRAGCIAVVAGHCADAAFNGWDRSVCRV